MTWPLTRALASLDVRMTTHGFADVPLPTVAEVLLLAELARGEPYVMAGGDGLTARVRWVHASELSDVGSFVEGGELILTTGIGLSSSSSALRRYVDELADASVSGLVVELGRKFEELPTALVEQADRRGMPLVVLRREVRFVRVTEEVHRLIVGAHIEELQAANEAHATFTELSVEGASPDTIVAHLAEITGRPVILENLTHQAVSIGGASGKKQSVLLKDWERRSRLMLSRGRTTQVSEDPVWLATLVAARGERWGRLLLQTETTTHRIMLEQAATAIALNRLVERDRDTLERSAHRSLLEKIAERTYSSAAEVVVRGNALGVPLADRVLVGVFVRVDRRSSEDGIERQARQRDDAERVAAATRELGMPALVSPLEPEGTGMLLPFASRRDVHSGIEALARTVHGALTRAEPGLSAIISVGATVERIADVRRSLREAIHISEAVHSVEEGKLYYVLEDVRVRGLLHMMRDDVRLRTFVERELGSLLEYDERHGTRLFAVLLSFLRNAGNKSAAAEEAGISRPSFYQRLERISQILGLNLDEPDVRLSLHLAATALDVMRMADQKGPYSPA